MIYRNGMAGGLVTTYSYVLHVVMQHSKLYDTTFNIATKRTFSSTNNKKQKKQEHTLLNVSFVLRVEKHFVGA